MILDIALKEAGLSKSQLADNLGITVKAVYGWKSPPQYAVAYLELYIKYRQSTQTKAWLKKWLNE